MIGWCLQYDGSNMFGALKFGIFQRSVFLLFGKVTVNHFRVDKGGPYLSHFSAFILKKTGHRYSANCGNVASLIHTLIFSFI